MKLLNSLRNAICELNAFERVLWAISLMMVSASFLLGGGGDTLTLAASLIGVTALIFVARGHVLGQMLTLAFSVMYALISLKQRYYGEMITYMGMTAPIAALSIITWLRHPSQPGSSEVKAARLTVRQHALMWTLAVLVTGVFHVLLAWLGNASLAASTISVTTSFLASWLMMMRSPAYALAYAANDLVLIVLWIIASRADASQTPMVVCFLMFFLNDMYGFVNWRRMLRRQTADEADNADGLDAAV